MNNHKKKCEHLKQIRKNMADAVGVELNQTVCTYEGDCKGTCPKCEQEERKLSAALLKGTLVATSAALVLTGCAKDPGALEGDVPYIEKDIEDYDGGISLPDDDEEIIELEGDVEYVGEVE